MPIDYIEFYLLLICLKFMSSNYFCICIFFNLQEEFLSKKWIFILNEVSPLSLAFFHYWTVEIKQWNKMFCHVEMFLGVKRNLAPKRYSLLSALFFLFRWQARLSPRCFLAHQKRETNERIMRPLFLRECARATTSLFLEAESEWFAAKGRRLSASPRTPE